VFTKIGQIFGLNFVLYKSKNQKHNNITGFTIPGTKEIYINLSINNPAIEKKDCGPTRSLEAPNTQTHLLLTLPSSISARVLYIPFNQGSGLLVSNYAIVYSGNLKKLS